jgi:hypothetical protein
MINSNNRITRRTMLRGAGGVAIGLPFLEAMLLPGTSHAATIAPLRLVVFYSPGGTLINNWRPTGTETNYTLNSMMAPLNPYKDRLLFLDGLNLDITKIGVGHPHSRGMAGVLTGTKLLPGTFETGMGLAGFADGPSVDQVIASRISTGLKFQSLEFSSGWSISGRSAGEVSFAADQITYQASNKPIPPQINTISAFKRIFGDAPAGGGGATPPPATNTRVKSILDAVLGQYTAVSAKLSAADKIKLSDHMEQIRQMETSLTVTPVTPSSACVVPPMPTTSGGSGTNGMQSGSGIVVSATDVPDKGKIMTDLMVASLACNTTRVSTMQWADSEAKFLLNFPPLGLPEHHHAYQHEKGFQPDALNKIYNWYASNFAYLLKQMDAVKEGDVSLLDNSLVFWVTEISSPEDHGQTNMPFVLAGKAQGKIKTGRWLKVPSQPHNNLLVSLLNIYGGTDTTFGDPKYCTGALAGLT